MKVRYVGSMVVFFLLLTSTARADAFQFINKNNGALAVEAAVSFGGQLLGYANGQGIIFIHSPQGQNTFTVSSMGQMFTVELTVSGNPQVQIIALDPDRK